MCIENNSITPPQSKVENNKIFLAAIGIEFSIFEPTTTGLKKSILDAIQPVRTLFELTGFHNYLAQLQGPAYKVKKEAFFLDSSTTVASKVSLYRPITKMGDPRMWFTGLGDFAMPTEKIAIIVYEDALYLINLCRVSLEEEAEVVNSHVFRFLSKVKYTQGSVAKELLAKLRVLAEKPLLAIKKGDTAVGMTIEAALGIKANSDKAPDYKGIELKSGRGGKNRTTLFAQVADWSLSTCKKSAEILDKYGYMRGFDKKLYCTVSSLRNNSQGLSFNYVESKDELHEIHENGDHVVTWSGNLLRNRLREKHAETFWIKTRSELMDGEEYFFLESVIHTKSPLLSQLMPLLENGVITMDHLIKRTGGVKPRVSEKGPLFKIDKKNLSLLVPEPVMYELV